MVTERKIEAERRRLDSIREAKEAEKKKRDQLERKEVRESLPTLIAQRDLNKAVRLAYKVGLLDEIPEKYLREAIGQFTETDDPDALRIGVAVCECVHDTKLKDSTENKLSHALRRENAQKFLHSMTDGML